MRIKKLLCMLLACGAIICNSSVVSATSRENDILDLDSMSCELVMYIQGHVESGRTARATSKFDIQVPGDATMSASSSFPLEAGETVTINAVYSPRSASVDFGLIAPDGLFHYINTTDGNIDKTIRVDQRGNYTFAVRNNSSDTISVSGFVNY